VPSNGTVVKIFTHPENDLDVHVRYDMDLMINSNAYEILLIRLFHAGRRALRRERVFRDRTKPLDIYDDFELIDKYRFDRQSIVMICDMLQDDLESSTFRNRAYFFFM
jgi:hypothetical protein